MKIKKLIASLLTAVLMTTSIVIPQSGNPFCVISSAATTSNSYSSKTPTITKKTSNESTINIYWKKISGVSYYAIYQYDSSKKKYVYLGYTNSNSVSINNLASNTTYKFAITSAYAKNKKIYTYSNSTTYVTANTQKAQTIETPDFRGWLLADAYDLLIDAGVSKNNIKYTTNNGKSIYVKHNFKIISQEFKNGKLYFVCERVKYTGIIDATYDFISSDEYRQAVKTIEKAQEVYDEFKWFASLFDE